MRMIDPNPYSPPGPLAAGRRWFEDYHFDFWFSVAAVATLVFFPLLGLVFLILMLFEGDWADRGRAFLMYVAGMLLWLFVAAVIMFCFVLLAVWEFI